MPSALKPGTIFHDPIQDPDDITERNLPVESLFTMATGIVRMLERIMYRHMDGKSELA